MPTNAGSPLHFSCERLIGREAELSIAGAAIDEAQAGRALLLTVRGEPGIGKTRVVEEIARLGAASGGLTLIGRCHEAVDAPALWPWSQILEGYLRNCGANALDEELRAILAPIGEVLPELARHVGPLRGNPLLEPERARFRAFDSVARFLEAASRRQWLVVVLEDAHAADSWSLRLLDFVARDRPNARLLLVASHREEEVGSVLATVLAGLAGKANHRALSLSRLSFEESALLIEQASGSRVAPALKNSVVRRSEGNPLFILELLREWNTTKEANAAPRSTAIEEVESERVPATIRALIGRRLEHLSTRALLVLTTAAAVGREFDVTELERVSGIDRAELLELIDEARLRTVLADVPGRIGRYRFSHALVRECLYERLGSGKRGELHHRIGVALEELHGDDIARYLPEIADHFFRGALGHDVEKAFAYTVRCGRSAAAHHAYEEAARHFGRALKLWGKTTERRAETRCELLIDLGSVQQWAGEAEQGRATLLEAVRLAREIHAEGGRRGGELLARAILAQMQTARVIGIHDAELVALLEEGLAAVGGDSTLRARLLGNLAIAHYWSDAVEERDALSAEAVAMARRIGDVDTLAFTLFARHFAILSPARVPEQLAIAEEAVNLGERSRSGEVGLTGRFWQFVDLLNLGEVEEARRHWSEYARTADELRQPFFQANAAVAAATFAMLEGRLAEAEGHAVRALELGRRAGSPNGEQYFGIQMFSLARLRGNEEMVLEPARTFIERAPGIPAWRAALASIYATLGRRRDAERELERLAERDFAGLPQDWNFVVTLSLCAEACVLLEQRRPARILYDMLRPYASRSVVIAIGAGHLGVVSHYLGLLASLLGRADRADAWLAEALERYEAMGARPFVARALIDRAILASGVRARAHSDDAADPIRAMLERGLGIAREIGLSRLVESAERALAGRTASAPKAGSAAAPGAALFRSEGEYWTIVFGNVTTRVRDIKGLRYLQELLRAPARDLHVLELVATTSPPSDARRPAERMGRRGSDAGPLADPRARNEYRRRIADLRREIEEAEARSDAGSLAAARLELEQLTQHLAATFGLGQRERRFAALTEKARLNVTRAIRAAIRRIGIAHPALARHLESTVVTGRLCRYEPPRDGSPAWNF